MVSVWLKLRPLPVRETQCLSKTYLRMDRNKSPDLFNLAVPKAHFVSSRGRNWSNPPLLAWLRKLEIRRGHHHLSLGQLTLLPPPPAAEKVNCKAATYFLTQCITLNCMSSRRVNYNITQIKPRTEEEYIII